MMNRAIGLSVKVDITEDVFRDCAAAGIDYLEISPTEQQWKNPLPMQYFVEMAKKYSLRLWSVHLPFCPFSDYDISALEENARTQAVSRHMEKIREVAAYGIKLLIIHPSGEPIEEGERLERILQAKRSLKTLCDCAQSFGMTIAVEDLPRTCLGRDSSDIVQFIEHDERLKVCFDTNHLLSENVCDFVRAVGDRIITTHVSDFDFINERHWLPGEGDIDWRALMQSLDEVGYDGPILYELASLGTTNTIVRERNATTFDIVQNAKNLACGENFPFSGKRVPRLGMWGPILDEEQ